MKEALRKISRVCKIIFGYGIMITLFVGGLTFFGYMAAFIIGGPTAEAICVFVYKQIIPVMIYATTCLVLFGIVAMYLAGEYALVSDRKATKHEDIER
ncbi:MAG: hypothetical protein ACOX75_00150 [Lachnospiraceae bacterium]|jgi:hypothetical protein